MLARLRARGFAPAFIYIFDEVRVRVIVMVVRVRVPNPDPNPNPNPNQAWALIEAAWALLAEVLAPGAGPEALVLEPRFYPNPHPDADPNPNPNPHP